MDKCDTIQCDTINHFYVRSKAYACQLDYHTKPRKRYGKIENKNKKRMCSEEVVLVESVLKERKLFTCKRIFKMSTMGLTRMQVGSLLPVSQLLHK